MRHKRFARFLLILAMALLVALAVRLLLLTQFAVTAERSDLGLLAGDRVLVCRTYYGLKLPGSRLWGDVRWGYAQPLRGEVVAYRHPLQDGLTDMRGICMDRIYAVPGDTLYLDGTGNFVAHKATTSRLPHFEVPARGKRIAVTPDNARLLCATLRRSEARNATLQGDSILFVDGKRQTEVVFSQDYYWMAGRDGMAYGLVPHSLLIGRIVCVSFSLDAQRPYYAPLRPNRYFLPL